MKNIALIIAGGVGARMKQEIPKQFIHVYDKPVILYTLEAFQSHPMIDSIYVVCLDGWQMLVTSYAKQYGISKLEKVVIGGENGQDSIRNGLMEIVGKYRDKQDIAIIHDAIRPLVSPKVISDNIITCRKYGNATAVVPCNTAMLKSYDSIESVSQVSRDTVKMTQTPQSFFIQDIVQAHREALSKGITKSVASCTMYIELGKKVFLSGGSEKNIKITTSDDLEIFKAVISEKRQ